MQVAHRDRTVALDSNGPQAVQLRLTMTADAFEEQVAYKVIVEMWSKRSYGKVRKAWLSQFDRKEREVIGRYQALFYKWYLVTGAPGHVVVHVKTLKLLIRAANFFGGC